MFATEAILIRTTRLTDTSLIVHWFTEDEGLVKTVAKGALRPKSPFAGKLDLFFSGEIGVARARRGELHILREVCISNWREGLRKNYDSALMAGYFCQLAEGSVEAGHVDGELHDLLRRGLDYLDVHGAGMKALLHYEKQLAHLLGVSGGREPGLESLAGHLGRIPAARRQLEERLGGNP